MDDGYALCMNKWALDKSIKDELGLLLIISSLCAEKGYCYAGNKYLAELFKTDETTISKKVKKLISKEYIIAEYTRAGSVITARKLRLANMPTAIGKNAKENNIKEENIIINNNISKEKKFEKPTVEEIKEYCVSRGNGIDANYFYDFYESKNWMIGKNKMKDWKAAVRTWERNNKPVPTETKREKIIPKWFNEEIDNSTVDIELDEDFNNFIEDFRRQQ